MTITWRKPTASMANGNCAEVGSYRKARASYANHNCAEVGQDDTVIAVRDTKQEHLGDDRVTLEFPASAWAAFTRSLKL